MSATGLSIVDTTAKRSVVHIEERSNAHAPSWTALPSWLWRYWAAMRSILRECKLSWFAKNIWSVRIACWWQKVLTGCRSSHWKISFATCWSIKVSAPPDENDVLEQFEVEHLEATDPRGLCLWIAATNLNPVWTLQHSDTTKHPKCLVLLEVLMTTGLKATIVWTMIQEPSRTVSRTGDGATNAVF